jgi:GAF domain-containing protein
VSTHSTTPTDAARITHLEHQLEGEQLLRLRLGNVQIENRRLAAELAAAEQRVGQLAQLQAAILQLHGAHTVADVLRVIKEIVANLVGSEEMGIYLRQPDDSLTLLDGIGAGAAQADGPGDAIVSVPLRHQGQVVGLIAIFRLLPQKPGIEPIDRELFTLLSTHAAVALHHAGRHALAERSA